MLFRGADLPSRTQQKLWLQRTATLNNSPPDNHGVTAADMTGFAVVSCTSSTVAVEPPAGVISAVASGNK
jgi:hypothetical protein